MENIISFKEYIDKSNILIHSKVLNRLKSDFNKAINLDPSFSLFFDTNVLLRTYSISFNAREKLLDYFEKTVNNIHIPNTVQTEFIRHREDVIRRFFDNVTNKVPNDFRSEVISSIGSYLEKNKIILQDYTKFENELLNIKLSCEKLHTELVNQVGTKEKENSNLVFDDKLMDILSKTTLLEPLPQNEIDLCKKEYTELCKGIEIEKLDNFLNKPGKPFPGISDLKEKPDNPYGDYLIYFELMKYARNNRKDIVLLTYDTTKGDWMRKDKKPHLHYIDNFFQNTGQIIYILDAERVFEELLSISSKSLIQTKIDESENNETLTIGNLKNLLDTKYSEYKSKYDSPILLSEIYSELVENGYKNIDDIVFNLNRAERAFGEYLRVGEHGINRFSQIGNLRLRLRLGDPEYKVYDKKSGTYIIIDENFSEPYKHLLL